MVPIRQFPTPFGCNPPRFSVQYKSEPGISGQRRIIHGKNHPEKVYNTETAELVASRAFSYYGDPAGYEERLYLTPRGLLFPLWYRRGGVPYPEPAIKAVSKSAAQLWQEEPEA